MDLEKVSRYLELVKELQGKALELQAILEAEKKEILNRPPAVVLAFSKKKEETCKKV